MESFVQLTSCLSYREGGDGEVIDSGGGRSIERPYGKHNIIKHVEANPCVRPLRRSRPIPNIRDDHYWGSRDTRLCARFFISRVRGLCCTVLDVM